MVSLKPLFKPNAIYSKTNPKSLFTTPILTTPYLVDSIFRAVPKPIAAKQNRYASAITASKLPTALANMVTKPSGAVCTQF